MGTPKISSHDFYVAAKALCEKWKESNPVFPPWTWVPYKREEGYLSLENVCHFSSKEGLVDQHTFTEEESLELDTATLVESSTKETHMYDFHIVYSFAYRVPVLYFRGYQCDGQPLDLGEIQKDLPSYSLSLLNESKWTFMTQEEHPFLHRPWYTLHPCGTSDWMKLLLGCNQQKDLAIDRYLLSWLSVVGQAVGLRVPLNLHDKSLQKSFAPSMKHEDRSPRSIHSWLNFVY